MHTSRLWNIEGNKEVFSSLLDSTDVMQSVDFSSDGLFIATVAVEAQDITIWDASAGLKIKGSLKVNAETLKFPPCSRMYLQGAHRVLDDEFSWTIPECTPNFPCSLSRAILGQ